jgi:hypothetical protein
MITVKKVTKEELDNAKLNIGKLRERIAQMHANKLLNIKKD